ncbi:hypothetical protein NMY22_g18023 [Coprinellus aureogranulatus]|nr:hypothetical protein NMY22_g18023 [Coprinellus aureogranulatus]
MERRYYANTHGITHWPPEIQDYNKRFTKLLENIKSRHDPTVTTVAQGVLEWKRSQNARHIGLDMQAWLDRFYMSRIGIRFLIGQHVALNTQQAHEDYVGIICTKANVHDIVQESIENARFVCEEHYAMFKGPPVQLICPPSLTFAYVPGHLSHICFELLKNSLRAVVERYGVDSEDSGGYPPIKVIVVEGKEDITIKISDEGGGIPRSAIPLIWTYMYTTMESQSLDQDFQASDFKAPMAGFGYGLPLSRLVRIISSPLLCYPYLPSALSSASRMGLRRLSTSFIGTRALDLWVIRFLHLISHLVPFHMLESLSPPFPDLPLRMVDAAAIHMLTRSL